jgi:hypothetical protein
MFKRLQDLWFGHKTNEFWFDTIRKIEKHGWTAIYVGDYRTSPTWAYSIGFHTTLGQPEIIVFDVDQQQANALFHKLFGELKAGLILRDGERWSPDGVETPLVWRKVHESRLYDNDPENPWLGLAEDFANQSAAGPITAFQLVLSDQAGNLPWEAGYDERLRPLQRPLWEAVDLAADAAV